MKRCGHCRREFPLEQFYEVNHTKSGYSSWCRSCVQAEMAIRRRAEPEAVRAVDQKKYARLKADPARYAAHRLKQSAIRKAWAQRNRERVNAKNTEWRRRTRPELRWTYGITVEQYDAMLAAQGNGCAICGSPETGKKKLPVDHDHKTGQVRGVLCDLCNQGLGCFRDNPSLLMAAIEYLANHQERRAELATSPVV